MLALEYRRTETTGPEDGGEFAQFRHDGSG